MAVVGGEGAQGDAGEGGEEEGGGEEAEAFGEGIWEDGGDGDGA